MGLRQHLAACLALALVACTSSTSPSAATPRPAAAGAPTQAAAAQAPGSPAASAPTAPPTLDRIHVAYGAVTGVYIATFMAKESGLLEQYGLDADLQAIPGGPTLVQSMLAGEMDFAETAAPAPMAAVLEGADTVWVTTALDHPILLMVAAPDVQTLQDLRGQTIGANRVGTLTYEMTGLALRQAGLEMNRDVTVQQLGGQPELVAAMLSGQVAGGLLAPPAHIQAVQAGFHVVANLADQGILWQQAGALSTRRQNTERPDRVRNYVKAYSEALYRVRADREAAIDVLLKYAGINDRATAGETYDFMRDRFKLPPYPNPAAFEVAVQEDLAPSNPRARDLPLDSYYDDHFLHELEQSGFFDDLNARYPGAR
ncbi:MAG TPA: ABC transporter substrate-binding protein [Chloroflexota bacterium]|nr:ABC transporter substrate-binding protein [Chloroflexota bacterium]